MFHTGFQYGPVLSMAAWVTPSAASQSDSASRSAVMVPKVRTVRRACPFSPDTITQATTLFLWMSSPQQRGYTMSIVDVLRHVSRRSGGAHSAASVMRASRYRERQSVVPRGTRVQLKNGLATPSQPDLATLTPCGKQHTPRRHFHPRWRPTGHGNSNENGRGGERLGPRYGIGGWDAARVFVP